MARKSELGNTQRVLITIDAKMKDEADALFKSKNISFSEGARQAIRLMLSQEGGKAGSASAQNSITVDGETRKKAEKALTDMGLDVETAVNMFLTEVVRTGCIPFAVQSGHGSYRYALVPVEQPDDDAGQDD